MRLFIKKSKKEQIVKLAEEGGGFITAEILVVKNDLVTVVPDPLEREMWEEFEFRETA